MDEARSLTYSINVEANTSQAEASIRNITSNLGGLGGSTINIDADTSQAESNIRNVTSSLGGVQTQARSVVPALRRRRGVQLCHWTGQRVCQQRSVQRV